MSLVKVKGVGRFFFPAAAVLLALVMTPDAEARMGIFNGTPTEDQCRKCHGDNDNLPHPRLQTANPDRHHARVGKPIKGLARGSHDTVAPGEALNGEYECQTCHIPEDSGTGQTPLFVAPTDCLKCHTKNTVTGSPWRGSNVHHFTDTFRQRQCNLCHGFLSSSGSSWGSRDSSSSTDSGSSYSSGDSYSSGGSWGR